MKVVVTKNLMSGLLFACSGAAALIIAQGYRMGTAMRMGPGYFPTLTGGLLLLIGAILIVRSLLYPSASEKLAEWHLKPVVLVTAAILAFAVLIDTAGVAIAIGVMLVLARFASDHRRGTLLEFGVMLLVMCGLAVGIFVFGLDIPLRLLPG